MGLLIESPSFLQGGNVKQNSSLPLQGGEGRGEGVRQWAC